MIIQRLSVTDFRVFQGTHEFDLTPRIKNGKACPIVLFGGLNGTGKTTTLNAVRLALYGKQSLGYGTSKKTYNQFLANSIHRNKNNSVDVISSKIELEFSYATLGIEKKYKVIREWWIHDKDVSEKILISENEITLTELNNEQCQAFLNELIPIGISDLFFFDGEKISALADDAEGTALGDAIKKLIGLDIIDILSTDLNLLARNHVKKNSNLKTQQEMDELEIQLNLLEINAEQSLANYESINATVVEYQANASRLELELSNKGGAWASSREEEIKKHTALNVEKIEIENQIREIFSSSYPISIALEFTKKAVASLEEEQEAKRQLLLSATIQKEIVSLNKSIEENLSQNEAKTASKLIEKQFSKYNVLEGYNIVHDISDSSFTKITTSIRDASEIKKPELGKLTERLDNVFVALDESGKNISRAPEEGKIKPYIDKLNLIREKLTISVAKRTKELEIYKRYLREAIDVTRKLDKLFQELKGSENAERSHTLAISSRKMLLEFSSEMAIRKVKELEKAFILSFQKLTRKDDIHLSAQINAKNFSVTLVDENQKKVDKDTLSAGEKQIYAIAILEALAKTSGRHLPIIIDTPLGRLDSLHREKLINLYFPKASHQVIILSTDTEVDKQFHDELSPSISHAFKLDYDPISASTYATEGYFWNPSSVGEVYASK